MTHHMQHLDFPELSTQWKFVKENGKQGELKVKDLLSEILPLLTSDNFANEQTQREFNRR